MHKHQHTAPPDLFMQFRDKDRRSPVRQQFTDLTDLILTNPRTRGGQGNRLTEGSLNEALAAANLPARVERAVRAAMG